MINDFFKKSNVFAVVGVSRDTSKYGYKVYHDLVESGYVVYPINPKMEELEGKKVYPSLDSLPKKPDVVVCVVPSEVTEKILFEAKDLSIFKIWMQPGSESQDAIEFCIKNHIEVIYNQCIMIKKVVSE